MDKELRERYIKLMYDKIDKLNNLVGSEHFWISQDIEGDEAEFAVSTSECMFYNYSSPAEIVGFLEGMITAIKGRAGAP